MPGHSPPRDSQCSICPGRKCVKNGYSPFGTQAHLDFHSKRKLPNYKIWPSYGNYLSLLAGETSLTAKLGDCRFQTQEMPVHCNTDSVRFDGSERAGFYFRQICFPCAP